jgi:AraC-like DNA-binding protein
VRTSNVDVLWIARYDYEAGWELRPHHHNFFQMILFLEGRGVFTVEREGFPLCGGELFLIRPGESHGLHAESRLRTLDVKFRVSRTIAGALASAARYLEHSEMAARLERIRAEGERKAAWYRELCSVLMAEILLLYLRQPDAVALPDGSEMIVEEELHDATLHRALVFVREHSKEQITVSEIACAAGCSERSLRSHFQKSLHTSPLAYLQDHRIGRARELIRYSDYSLKEISRRVGFQNIHHFTRLFTAAEACSPAAWRRQYLQGVHKDVHIDPDFTNRIFTVRP